MASRKHNNRLMCDLRSVGLFCGVYHKKFQLHSGAIAGRYAVLNPMKLQIAAIALIFSGEAYSDPDCSDFGEKDRGVNSRTAICESVAVSDEYFLVKNELLSVLKSYGANVNGKPHWHEELSAVVESVENYEKLVEQFADQSCFLIDTGNGQNMSGVNTMLCTLEYKKRSLLVLKQLLKTCKENLPAEGRNVCEYE